MATSTVPAVKAAVFDLMDAWPGLAGVQVAWAKPSLDVLQHEAIWFAGADAPQRAEALGNQRRDETFTLTVIVSVLVDGDDARGCELRMWELVAELEQLVRQNPKPIPAPLFDIQYGGARQRDEPAEGQRISNADVSIVGRARI